MSVAERDNILDDLAILSLRRRRLSAFIAKEGLLLQKRHPVSGNVCGLKPGLGIGRYSTAIDNQFFPLFARLLYSPEQLAAMAEARKRDDELLVPLPYAVPVQASPQLELAPEQESCVDPTAGWFAMPRRWDHAPGSPSEDGEVAETLDDPALLDVD